MKVCNGMANVVGFCGHDFLVSATLGPNMLLVMSQVARFGIRAALQSMTGCMSALMCMVSPSAAGVVALLLTFTAVFDVLRYVGAAYLA
jgi:threonine/homoserine/homoserine lactone efflux protein